MPDVRRAAKELTDSALTKGIDPKELRPFVEKVLKDWDKAKDPDRAAAVKVLTTALPKASGGAARVLILALGALVENGGAPEPAWKALSPFLVQFLEDAAKLASAAIKLAKDPHVDTAIEKVGAELAKKKPKEAEAWKSVPAGALAGIACLIRSKKVRKEPGNVDLFTVAWPLSDVFEEVGDLVAALRILDDANVLVIDPAQGKAWRLKVDGIATIDELQALLLSALKLPSGRFLSWHDQDGHLHGEESPIDLPLLEGDRVLLLTPAKKSKAKVRKTFDELESKASLVKELTPAEVMAKTRSVTLAVAHLDTPAPASAKKKAPRKKTK